jgi:hypothetical protein
MSMHNSKMAYDKNEEYKAIPVENLPRYLLNRRTARLNCPNIVERTYHLFVLQAIPYVFTGQPLMQTII